MTTAHDVAAYLLHAHGPMTAYKLQKLLYYSQVWSVVWDGGPLFAEQPHAWSNGPVVTQVWDQHRGTHWVRSYPGDRNELSASERETVDGVLDFYGEYEGDQLSDLTHRELPWIETEPNRPITVEAMRDFYGALPELRSCGKRLPRSYRRGVEMLLGMTQAELVAFYSADAAEEDSSDWLSSL